MFETASNWEVINNYTEVTYPSGRMRVRNSTSGSRTIGVKKDFITGTGEHTVSFDVTLPIFSCIGGIVMGASSTDSLGSGFNASDTIAGVENYQTLSYPSDFYAVVEIRDENNSIVLKDSTNITATHSYTFSAPQGKEYNISLYSNRFCGNLGYQIDNVFISYDTLEVITGNTIIVSDTLFIINNDFENPVIEPNGAGVKIDGWTHYSPSTTLSVEPHNGSDWLKVVSTNGTHGAHQGFSVEPGETYTFEIDLHRPAGMNNVINIVIWQNTGPSGAYTLHVLNTDGSNTFNYTATSSNIYIQIRQAGTYYLDNIRMYRTYEDTVFVGGFDVDMAYRYGFQGQEKDDEIKGEGNSINYKYRMHDTRVGRFLSIDPLAKKYPFYSPYVFSGNRVIDAYELEGMEPLKDENGKINGDFKPKFKLNLPNGDKATIYVHGGTYVVSEEDKKKINSFREQGFSTSPRNIYDNSYVHDDGSQVEIKAGSGGVTQYNDFPNNQFRTTLIQAPSEITQTVPLNMPGSTNQGVTGGLLGAARTRNGLPKPVSTFNTADYKSQIDYTFGRIDERVQDLLGNQPANTTRSITSIDITVSNDATLESIQRLTDRFSDFNVPVNITQGDTGASNTFSLGTINYNDQTTQTVRTQTLEEVK